MKLNGFTLCATLLPLLGLSSRAAWAQQVPPRRTIPTPLARASQGVTIAPQAFALDDSSSLTVKTPPASAAGDASSHAHPSVQPVPSAPRVLFFDEGTADGGVWVRGENFKMHFVSDGATYIPFFGSRAPRNFEIRLALQQVTVDGAPIDLVHNATAERSQNRVSVDRGVVQELYEISPRAVEQQFVIESRPAAGEWVFQVSVETELTRSITADGFEFANKFGRVHCGRATAIDAQGRSLELETELGSCALTIRVPASFAADAALPIVIDPLWYTVGIENGSTVSLQPDIAHATGDYLFVCWEQIYSASDHDVLCELIDSGGAVYSAFYADFTASYWARPRCAHITAGDRVLVAAEVGTSGSRSIWGRATQVAQPSSPVSTGQFEISDPLTQGEKFHLDVGGDPYPHPPSYFCVVYENTIASNDHDIFARLVDGDGALASGTIAVDNSFSTLDAEPAISSTDDSTIWNLAWQREVAPGNNDIFAARIQWNGAMVTWPFPLPATATNDQHPTVSGPIEGTNRFMVVWEHLYPYISGDYDLYACLLDDASLLWYSGLAQTSEPEVQPDLGGNGRHFVCSYAYRVPGGTDYDVAIKDIEPAGNLCNVGETANISSAGNDLGPCIVNHEDSDSANFSILYFAIFNHLDDIQMSAYVGLVGGSIQSICGQSPGLTCPCGSPGTSGLGCPNSVHASGAGLHYNGSASTVADTLSFDFADVPPNVSCLLFQGTQPGQFTFGDGVRCMAQPFVRFPLRAANWAGVTGYGSLYGDVPISVRGGVPALGGLYVYQVWYRDPAAFCTPDTTNMTNALRVFWTP
jgi:hypothetical protein